jgi:uncharacterized repeat protein (TIGR02543 family)
MNGGTVTDTDGNVIDHKMVRDRERVTGVAVPTRSGHVFDGWFLDAGLTARPFNMATDTINAGGQTMIALRAKWTAVQTFSVFFNTYGGSSVDTRHIEAGGLILNLINPTRTDFIFDGWFRDAAYTQAFNILTPVTATMTLHARWRPVGGGTVEEILVTFNTMGGSPVDSVRVLEGGTVTQPSNPTRAGFIFDGWFREQGLLNPFNFQTPINAPITIWARWEADVSDLHLVTFRTGAAGVTVSPQHIADGGTATSPSPGRDGFTFEGWYREQTHINRFDFNTPITGDLELWARWETAPEASYARLLINQVYGLSNNGYRDNPVSHSFIELYNPTNAAVNLAGWSIQIVSEGRGANWQSLNLSGTIGSRHSFLIKLTRHSNTSTGSDAPRLLLTASDMQWPDVFLSNRSIKVALLHRQTLLTHENPFGLGEDGRQTLGLVSMVGVSGNDSDPVDGGEYEDPQRDAPRVRSRSFSFRRVSYARGGSTDCNFRDSRDNSEDFDAIDFRFRDIVEYRPRSLADGAWTETLDDSRPWHFVRQSQTSVPVSERRQGLPRIDITDNDLGNITAAQYRAGIRQRENGRPAPVVGSPLITALETIRHDDRYHRSSDANHDNPNGIPNYFITPYARCNITVSNTFLGKFDIPTTLGQIRVRGSGSASSGGKTPYRIRFDDRTSMFGQERRRSWILLAMMTDLSNIRDFSAMTFARQLDGLEYTSSATHVELYMNGQYRGVYLLMEQQQTGHGRIDIEFDERDTTLVNSFTRENIPFYVDLDEYNETERDRRGTGDGNMFTLSNSFRPRVFATDSSNGDTLYTVTSPLSVRIQYPEMNRFRNTETDVHGIEHEGNSVRQNQWYGWIRDEMVRINNLVNAVSNANAAASNAAYRALQAHLDIDSVIDFYMASELLGQMEISKKSILMYRHHGGKLKMGPIWDFDWAIGADHYDSYAGPRARNTPGNFQGRSNVPMQGPGWFTARRHDHNGRNPSAGNSHYWSGGSFNWFTSLRNSSEFRRDFRARFETVRHIFSENIDNVEAFKPYLQAASQRQESSEWRYFERHNFGIQRWHRPPNPNRPLWTWNSYPNGVIGFLNDRRLEHEHRSGVQDARSFNTEFDLVIWYMRQRLIFMEEATAGDRA